MATKKKAVTKAKPQEEKVKKPALCGHVNRHSLGVNNKLDNLKCDLKNGHSGDHSGVHTELQRAEDTQIINGEEVIKVTYEKVDVRRGWTAMAGTPVSEMPVPPEPKPATLMDIDNRLRKLEQDGKWDPNKKLSEV